MGWLRAFSLVSGGLVALHVCPVLLADVLPMPELVDRGGYLLFVSAARLEDDWATGEFRSYNSRFEESAPEIGFLFARLNGAASPGMVEVCGAAVPPPDTDDEQAGAADVRVRSIGSEISGIGVVTAISPGWSATFDAPVQLVRLSVVSLFQDRGQVVTEGSDLLILVPGGFLRAGNRSLCVQRGRWPVLALGDRLLVSGFWRLPAPRLVTPIDLVPIAEGRLLLDAALRGGAQTPGSMTEAELEAWWRERKTPK